MTSKLKILSVLLLATALAGCSSATTGSINPGSGNGGNNGDGGNGGNDGGNNNGDGGNGGDANLVTSKFRGHFIRSNRANLKDTVVEKGELTASLPADRAQASASVTSGALNIPGATNLPLTETDAGVEVFGQEDDSFLTIYSGKEALGGENYQMALYGTQDTSNFHGGIGISGDITPASQVKASATYNGVAGGFARAENDPDVYGWGGQSKIALAVADGQAHVQGDITNIYVEDIGFIPAYISLERAPVNNESYEGSTQLRFLGNGNPLPTSQDSNYQGAFYGENAAETAGTFHTSGTVTLPTGNVGDIEVLGGFGGSKPKN